MLSSLRSYSFSRFFNSTEKNSLDAYDAWAESYDNQPGNLMLDLDEKILDELLKLVDLHNCAIADIGCGTGRHWKRLYRENPSQILGFDVSAGMLEKLHEKYPEAITHQINDNHLDVLGDSSVDFILNTLTIAHIENPNDALKAWVRVLKKGRYMLITDFHPDLLQKGGKRTFKYRGRTLFVKNFIHPVPNLIRLLEENGMKLVRKSETVMDESVEQYYKAQNADSIFRRYKGTAIIYGLLLKKESAAK